VGLRHLAAAINILTGAGVAYAMYFWLFTPLLEAGAAGRILGPRLGHTRRPGRAGGACDHRGDSRLHHLATVIGAPFMT